MDGLLIYIFASLLIGSIICFWGSKIYIPFLCISASIVTAAIVLGEFGFTSKGILISLVLCVILNLLIRFILRFALFLMGALCGGMLGLFFSDFIPVQMAGYKGWITLIIAIVLGISCAIGRDFFISLATAYSGATIIATPTYFLILNVFNLQNFVYANGAMNSILKIREYLNDVFFSQHVAVLMPGILILTAIGFFYQRQT